MIYSLSIGRICSIILRNHECLSQIWPISPGSNSTKAHIVSPKRAIYPKSSIFIFSFPLFFK